MSNASSSMTPGSGARDVQLAPPIELTNWNPSGIAGPQAASGKAEAAGAVPANVSPPRTRASHRRSRPSPTASPAVPPRQSSLARRSTIDPNFDDDEPVAGVLEEKADQENVVGNDDEPSNRPEEQTRMKEARAANEAAGARTSVHRQISGQAKYSASQAGLLLNLPPPPPFALKVNSLNIGLPPPKSISWLPGPLRRKLGPKAPDDANKKSWILNDVSCECHPGEVLAILGGSGSGKTTLLNAIAHRLSLPVAGGSVSYLRPSSSSSSASEAVSPRAASQTPASASVLSLPPDHPLPHSDRELGSSLSRSQIRKRIGFVRQQDYLLPHLTVRETLTYAARLRLPSSLEDETIRLIVEETMDELGLRTAADTYVGGPLRKGISGGEKRRLTIGCVLVTLPSVLILDEPTSGLDAFTSYLLLLTLSQLARRGRTIILSIHAPRSDAFELFDRIALLSKGEMVYSGLTVGCLDWFAGLGHHVQRGTNPLDFLIDISTVDNRDPDKEDASKARVKTLVDAWRGRGSTDQAELEALAREKEAMMSSSSVDLSSSFPTPPQRGGTDARALEERPGDAAKGPMSELQRQLSKQTYNAEDARRPGFLKQTRVLIGRAHKNAYRNWPVMAGVVGQGMLLGIIFGFTFYQLPDTPTGIQSLKNFTFQLIPAVFYLQQVFWIYKYCADLEIFSREREDNLYDVIPYVVSDWISFLAVSVASPTIYIILCYFIIGLRKDQLAARLFILIADTALVQFCVMGASFLSAALLRSFAAASTLGNSLNLFQIMSAGFILTHVPPYVAWIRWISPYFYSFRIVATGQFKDRQFHCPADSGANLAQCNGNSVLRGLNFDASTNIGIWFSGLIGLAIIEYALACFVLYISPTSGQKHAREIDSGHRGKGVDVHESKMIRERIDVEIRGLSLIWKRRKTGPVSAKRKVLLDEVSARFPAGEISAILGPSGAGKSTLLQLIASRHLATAPLSRFSSSGSILFNGQPASASSKSNIAFVEQDDDWHLPSLTVRETLRYAAVLRLPKGMKRREKEARAETVLRMLGLKDCADLPVGGGKLKGISGGEKRRLSLAVQMINDPAILVVDEPTSGLDSSIALSVMQVLRDIAASGRTVIATIHQPRSDIWQLADNVTLLARGGLVAFSGRRSEAVDYFASISYPMPSLYFNPADHLLDLVSIDSRKTYTANSVARVENLISTWRSQQTHPTAEELGTTSGSGVTSRGEGSTPFWIAGPVVLERHWKALWRRKDVFFARLVQIPLLGALFLLFFQRLTHGPAGAQDRIGVTIENTSAIPFVGLLNAMAIFPLDRDLYLHESKSSARYGAATFIGTYTLVEIGLELLGSFGYAAIMNVAVGLQTSARIYFEFAITIWAMVNMGESFAIILATWIPVEGLTVTIVSTLLSLVGQISGVISLSVPDWLAGIAWATVVKPATRIQIINEAIGLKFNCSEAQIQSGQCVAQNGQQLLALFGWKDLNTARYMGIMVAICIAWRMVAWFSVKLKVGVWG